LHCCPIVVQNYCAANISHIQIATISSQTNKNKQCPLITKIHLMKI
jgi:hypothetical protein